MRLKKALEKLMLKAIRTTGRFRTRGVRTGAIMVSSRWKSRMAMVSAASTRTESTGPLGTGIPLRFDL